MMLLQLGSGDPLLLIYYIKDLLLKKNMKNNKLNNIVEHMKIDKNFKKYISKLRRKYLHWKWKRRWNKAWNISCWKASGFYHENIDACSPLYYFWDELEDLKKYTKD